MQDAVVQLCTNTLTHSRISTQVHTHTHKMKCVQQQLCLLCFPTRSLFDSPEEL